MFDKLFNHAQQFGLRVSLKSLAQMAGLSVILLGGWALSGLALDITLFGHVVPGPATIELDIALISILAGISLCLSANSRTSLWQHLAQACAVCLVGLALFCLSQNLLGGNLGLAQLLFRASKAAAGASAHMSSLVAFSFSLIGIALWLGAVKPRSSGLVIQILALLPGFVALLTIVDYFYHIRLQNYAYASFMPLPTALILCILPLAILGIQPEQGILATLTAKTTGGWIMRRLLPAAIVIPFGLGWLGVWGLGPSLYDTQTKGAILVLINVVILTTLISWNAQVLHRADLNRRQVEESLRESEERFRATFEQAAVGISHTTLGGQRLRVNQKLCDIGGYTREEFLTQEFQKFSRPEDQEIDRIYIPKLLAGEISTYSTEKRGIHKDGSTVWINATISVAHGPMGEPEYFISVVEDITKRKILEEQFRQAQKMEAVGQLSGGIAHDFNNLLVVINGYSELVLNHYLNRNHPAYKYVEQIKKAGERAGGLTRQLLAFSRQQVLQPEIFNLNDTVVNMEKMLHRLISEDIALVTLLDARLGQVKADPGQIEMVIMNLVVNARDAMPQGGKLIIETANVKLDEDLSRQMEITSDRYVMIAVSDTGIGMNVETQSHIFEPFFTTKEPGKGTGLGLATVYGIVKQSGGNIWVYSELGRGASFKICFPRIDEVPVISEAPPQATAMLAGTETVLVVEDEELVRALTHQVLALSGYTVLVASHGQEALRLCQQQVGPIDLLLTDVVMPGGMNGHELADLLKSLYPKLKVLYMSGYMSQALNHYGVLESSLYFLPKPFTPSHLTYKVRQVLDTA